MFGWVIFFPRRIPCLWWIKIILQLCSIDVGFITKGVVFITNSVKPNSRRRGIIRLQYPCQHGMTKTVCMATQVDPVFESMEIRYITIDPSIQEHHRFIFWKKIKEKKRKWRERERKRRMGGVGVESPGATNQVNY